ncbi:hypothetical protein ACWGJ2_26275 [Streptomyces sp. NPDC054796]
MRGPLRVAGAVGAVGVLVGGVVACEPVAGGLNSAAVALTTDQAGTRSLESAGVDVQWMSCTATVGQRGGSASASASSSANGSGSGKARRQVAKVDCQGETKSGAEITVRGKVTEEHDGRCVRGDLTAKVGKRTVFRAEVLGNCAAPSASASSSQSGSEPPEETEPPGTESPEPTVTETVTPTGTTSPTAPPETPPVTVTVTASPDPPPSDPSPDPPPPCECETPGQRDAGTGR